MNLSIKNMVLVSMFSTLTIIGAFISFPIGPIPITLQSLFVILSGIILGAKLGAISQIIYLFLGLIGIPIFADFTGGLQIIMKPSFGFVIGFIFAAFVVGIIINSEKNVSNKKIFIATLIGTITIYIFGLPYMYYILNIVSGNELSFMSILKMGCLLFLPGDFIKIIIVSVIGKKLLKILNIPSLTSIN